MSAADGRSITFSGRGCMQPAAERPEPRSCFFPFRSDLDTGTGISDPGSVPGSEVRGIHCVDRAGLQSFLNPLSTRWCPDEPGGIDSKFIGVRRLPDPLCSSDAFVCRFESRASCPGVKIEGKRYDPGSERLSSAHADCRERSCTVSRPSLRKSNGRRGRGRKGNIPHIGVFLLCRRPCRVR